MGSPSAYILKHWREAATLIVVAPSVSQSRSKLTFGLTNANDQNKTSVNISARSRSKYNLIDSISEDYDVLMLKRNRRSKFMPNIYVYPGGAASDNDFSSGWLSLFRKLGENVQKMLFRKLTVGSAVSAPMFHRQRHPQFSQIPPEVAFRISAIRETFEESGVLLAVPVNQVNEITPVSSEDWSFSPSSFLSEDQDIMKWRERVNDNPDEFLTMCNELNLIPAVWSLYEWSNWMTPASAASAVTSGRRFDAIFFICCLDHKPEAFEDASETVDALWAKPSNLLHSYYESKMGLGHPQVYELSRMLNFSSHLDLMNYVAHRQPQRVERWTTVPYFCQDYCLYLLPGDDLYPKGPDASETLILQSDKSFEELCRLYPHFHRIYHPMVEDGDERLTYISLQCNTVIDRGQVGPVTGLETQFELPSKL